MPQHCRRPLNVQQVARNDNCGDGGEKRVVILLALGEVISESGMQLVGVLGVAWAVDWRLGGGWLAWRQHPGHKASPNSLIIAPLCTPPTEVTYLYR